MEFKTTKESIENLLKLGAVYKMAQTPQFGTNLLKWEDIDNELKKNLNLNNCKYINTYDVFVLNGVEFLPIK